MRPVRWLVSAFVAFAVAWVTFMVPFGRYTLFQHARRIAATDEAQELGSSVSTASGQLRDEMQRQVGDALTRDGGVR